MKPKKTNSKTKLIEETISKSLGTLSSKGSLVVNTGKFTGRATKERFIVERAEAKEKVFWGNANVPIDETFANSFFESLERKLASSGETYRFEGSVGGRAIEVTSFSPWHIAFADNMFRCEPVASLMNDLNRSHLADKKIRIFHDPHGTVSELGLKSESETLIILDPEELKIGIVGTAYAGEIKKSAFSTCNYFLPDLGILPMHASANCLPGGKETCVLFGLSGTGKTTLSASPDRLLIGDDELVWTDRGISNLEGGCYAKLIDITEESEPEIFRAVNQFGSIVENVDYSEKTREVDFSSRKNTENTRGSYPISLFENVYDQSAEAEAPKTIVFLMADAFGALPAVAKLDYWQTQYHFLSGYTAKVAGTELGVTEPKAAFSACFGEPFMPRHPAVYSRLLAEKAKASGASVWILNTGWLYENGKRGSRFPLQVSRALLRAIQSGELSRAPMKEHPVFGFQVPSECAGIDSKWLNIPEGDRVRNLAEKFVENMKRFEAQTERETLTRGGPRLEHQENPTEKIAANSPEISPGL